jgi:hypothetical protein
VIESTARQRPLQSVVTDSIRYAPVIAVPVASPGGILVTTLASRSLEPPPHAATTRQTASCFMAAVVCSLRAVNIRLRFAHPG